MKTRYETDLSDEQWEVVQPLVEATTGCNASVSRREIVNAILYIARNGWQWRLLPTDFAKWSTVHSCYHRWAWSGTLDKLHRESRAQMRSIHGKSTQASAGIVNSQSMKVTAKAGTPAMRLCRRQTPERTQAFCGVLYVGVAA